MIALVVSIAFGALLMSVALLADYAIRTAGRVKTLEIRLQEHRDFTDLLHQRLVRRAPSTQDRESEPRMSKARPGYLRQSGGIPATDFNRSPRHGGNFNPLAGADANTGAAEFGNHVWFVCEENDHTEMKKSDQGLTKFRTKMHLVSLAIDSVTGKDGKFPECCGWPMCQLDFTDEQKEPYKSAIAKHQAKHAAGNGKKRGRGIPRDLGDSPDGEFAAGDRFRWERRLAS